MQRGRSHLVHISCVNFWHTLQRLRFENSTIDGQWLIWSYRTSSGALFLWTTRFFAYFCWGSSSDTSTGSPDGRLLLRFFVSTLSITFSESQAINTLLTDVAKDKRSRRSFLGARRCSQWRLYKIQPCTTHEVRTQKKIRLYHFIEL